MGILTNEYGEKWLSSLIFNDNDPSLNWREGDTVMVKVEENGQYMNFDVPDKVDMLEARVEVLEAFMKNGNHAKMRDEVPKEEEIQENDLPF